MCVFAAAAAGTVGGMTAGMATMANISMGMQGIGMVMQYQGQKAQAQAQQQQYDYQAQVNENNKQIAEWQAQDAVDRGSVKEKQHRIKVSQLKGRQRSVLAASGVEVDDGSALDILGDTAELGELDALTIRSNSEREAYDYKVAAMNQGAQAGINRVSGQNAASAGRYGAMTSLLSGAGSIADKWYGYKYG